MKQISWKSFSGTNCVLSINDGTSAVTTLEAADAPFVTSIDAVDDIFSPIRSQSGYIRVVCDIDDVRRLVGSRPLDRSVVLTVNNVIRWRGYLSCETFTQPWDRGPLELELPVVSPLGILAGLHPSSALADMRYKRFVRVILDINDALGAPFTKFVFPTLSDASETLRYQCNMMLYATENEDGTGRTMESYDVILTDICKLFGWSVQEYGEYLVFLAADTKSVMIDHQANFRYNYEAYTIADMCSIEEGLDHNTEEILWAVRDVEIWGDAHDMDLIAGKKRVRVVGNLGEYSGKLFSLDITGDGTFEGGSGLQIAVGQSYYNRNYQAGGMVQVFNDLQNGQGCNIKYRDAEEARLEAVTGDSNHLGGCFANEMRYNFDGGNVTGDENFKSRLIMRASTNTGWYLCARIRTGFYFVPSVLTGTDARFVIAGYVEKAQSYYDLFEAMGGDGDGEYLCAALKVGDKYYNGDYDNYRSDIYYNTINVHDGKITRSRFYSSGYALEGIYFRTPAPDSGVSGEVVLEFYVPSPGVRIGKGTEYYAVSDLTLSLTRSWKVIGLDEEHKSENVAQRNIAGGFSESYDTECNLTIARASNLPMSLGVVLDDAGELPVSLYDDEYPEDALAERLYAYFSQSRQRIAVTVHGVGNKYLEPTKLYRLLSGGNGYVCVAQTLDWKSEQLKAWMYEPSYIES